MKVTNMPKMINEQGLVADVHENEVQNYALGGYVACDAQPQNPPTVGTLSKSAIDLIEKEGQNPQDFIDAGITTVAAVKARIAELKGTPTTPPAPAAVNMDELRFEPEALALAKDAGAELADIIASSETGVVTVADVTSYLDALTGE